MKIQKTPKGLQRVNPLIGGPDIYAGRPSRSQDGYVPIYQVKDGKRTRLGHVGNAAGLRWLLAMSGH